MNKCVAYKCRNKIVHGRWPFFSFPQDEVIREQWIEAVNKYKNNSNKFVPTEQSMLCLEHFEEEMLDRTSDSSVRLKENAIPTIFKCMEKVPKVSKCCSIFGCTTGLKKDRRQNKQLKRRMFTIFSEPSDSELANKWKKAIGNRWRKYDLQVVHVCELHFAEKHLNRISLQKVSGHSFHILERRRRSILRKDAIPSIFPKHPFEPTNDNPKELFRRRFWFDENKNYSRMLPNIPNIYNSLTIECRESDYQNHSAKLNTPQGAFLAAFVLNNLSDGQVNLIGGKNPLHKLMKFLDSSTFFPGLLAKSSGTSAVSIPAPFPPSLSYSAMERLTGNENTPAPLGVERNAVDPLSRMLSPFQALRQDFEKMVLPANWHTVPCFQGSIVCVKWNANYAVEKKFCIDNSFKLQVFIGEREVILQREAPRSPAEILAVIQKLDSLQACKGSTNKLVPNCLSILSPVTATLAESSGFCDNCILFNKRRARGLWRKAYDNIISHKRSVEQKVQYKKQHKTLLQRNRRLQRRIDKLQRQLRIEQSCSSVAVDFFS